MQHRTAKNYRWLAFWSGGLYALLLFVIINTPFDTTASLDNTSETHRTTRHHVRHSADSSAWTAQLPHLYHHIETPSELRGIYLSAWTAGTPSRRKESIEFIRESSTINAVIIDIKDSTGIISYKGKDPNMLAMGTYSNRIRNLSSVIKEFHKHDIYVIGRITAFEDPYLAGKHDALVLKTKLGDPWHSRKGSRQWIDPSNQEYYDYLVSIAREAYSLGVDEINLDYIRYPSEGATSDIQTPESMSKSDVITRFMQYMDARLRTESSIPLSIDVFGLTTTAQQNDDLGIGQKWEQLLPYVDYICPMIYPSHYADGSFGYSNPAEYPYDVISLSTLGSINRTLQLEQPITKIRPWIQDFDLGARYGESEVRAQIQALEDLGVRSWMSWDPANSYTQPAYTLLDSN